MIVAGLELIRMILNPSASPWHVGKPSERRDMLAALARRNRVPIVFVNQEGFFDPCLAQLERCIDERFMDPRHRDLWCVVATPGGVVDAIDRAPEWDADALDFAAV